MDGIDLFRDVSKKDFKRYMKESGITKQEVRDYVYNQDWYKDAPWYMKKGIKSAMKLKGLKRGGDVVDVDQDMIAKLIAAGANIEML